MATPDLSEFETLAAAAKSKQRPCGVAVAADKLEPAEKEQLLAAIEATKPEHGGRVTVGAVIQWCRQRDLALVQNTIVYHRTERCSCYVGS